MKTVQNNSPINNPDFFNQKIKPEPEKVEAMMIFAKAYHEAKLKEELIKYTIWHQDMMFKCHALEEAIEHGVIEYLKQR